jgi:hypothetical protein
VLKGKRNAGTRIKECLWHGTLAYGEAEETREVGWHLTIVNNGHNYKPSSKLSLPQYRKVNRDANFHHVIADSVRYSTSPTVVYTKLVEQKYIVTLNDVNNHMAKCRLKELRGRSKIEAL